MKRAPLISAIVLILLGLTLPCQADFLITDINGVANDGLYVYGEGNPADILGIPSLNPTFWTITTPSANTLFFETQIDVGFATADITLSGLEANDDWASAVISGTNGVPLLTYSGGDTANLNFNTQNDEWFTGDTITITFSSVPEPGSAIVFAGLPLLALIRRRKLSNAIGQ